MERQPMNVYKCAFQHGIKKQVIVYLNLLHLTIHKSQYLSKILPHKMDFPDKNLVTMLIFIKNWVVVGSDNLNRL